MRRFPKLQTLRLVQKRELGKFLRARFRISERRLCRLLGIGRSSMSYKSRKDPQHALRIRLRDLAASRVCYGYRRLHVLLRREGWMINLKRVRRLYNLEGLSLRLKKTKKRVSALRIVPPPAQQPMNAGDTVLIVKRSVGRD
jgi:putative transposase